MRYLRRLAGEAGLLAVLVLAVLGCYGIASDWSPAPARSAGASPLPKLPGEVRGPSLEVLLTRLNHLGLEWVSPPDVVE